MPRSAESSQIRKVRCDYPMVWGYHTYLVEFNNHEHENVFASSAANSKVTLRSECQYRDYMEYHDLVVVEDAKGLEWIGKDWLANSLVNGVHQIRNNSG